AVRGGRAPEAEDALAGALLIHLTRGGSPPPRDTGPVPADGPSTGARPAATTRRAGSPVGEPALLRSRRRSRGPPADHLARSRISTRRHRLVAEVGRVSMTRTRSPMPAVFSSS